MSSSLPAPDNQILRPTNPDALVLEAWGQGFMVGSLVVMAAITVVNMRRNVLLHKLIFAEVLLPLLSPAGHW
ncbi:hypothetical protein PHISCL_07240 [Aspergillus sclerotialis]|uniref:Uncharacterized protein n=1 Tax=Aspergillus sclerotialis TaxID=2070753 RepID=A0A3A2ZCT3_9EURO|nr:hypothetical protein PHISCL_07240 [Aspergillus sclerotialis]